MYSYLKLVKKVICSQLFQMLCTIERQLLVQTLAPTRNAQSHTHLSTSAALSGVPRDRERFERRRPVETRPPSLLRPAHSLCCRTGCVLNLVRIVFTALHFSCTCTRTFSYCATRWILELLLRPTNYEFEARGYDSTERSSPLD